jgi:hypothetical protein
MPEDAEPILHTESSVTRKCLASSPAAMASKEQTIGGGPNGSGGIIITGHIGSLVVI